MEDMVRFRHEATGTFTTRRLIEFRLFDVSKQVFGQMFVHGLNVLISGVISDATSGNACVSYFLNILIDTTLGIGIIYGVLHALTFLFSEKLGLKGFESGVYGNPPSLNYWCRQAATYVVALTAMKLAVILLLVLFPGIFKIGEWLLSWTWTGDGDALQVVFVMGIFPIAMNVLQFWLIDSIVKASSGPVALEPDSEDTAHPDREPLFNAPDDDDDDDHYRRGDVENQLSNRPSHSTLDSGRDSRAKSYTTGTTTPDDDEHKSVDTSARDQAHERHAYPPSLSSSVTSSSSSSSSRIKESTKLAKHHSLREKASNPASRSHSPHSSLRGTKTPDLPATHVNPIISTQDDWATSWDDDGDDGWESRVPPTDPKVPGHERDGGVGIQQQQQRARRLS
ncbi:hypothetical protein EST38_g410 [Candolleomyces aberdarensis]|uniref:Vacuolar membrane protein n=1 Tax=Candolleomyces aberdarensis TaxID=2316362 RepID=A0A4Q2DYN4_9AGAR|nr:hypothetical protein EST38_g410 [Candolleomyces aberdarensis]